MGERRPGAGAKKRWDGVGVLRDPHDCMAVGKGGSRVAGCVSRGRVMRQASHGHDKIWLCCKLCC